MDAQDKSEARAARVNVRHTRGGKGDRQRVSGDEMASAPVWCDCFPARFRDKCEVCK